jgi:tetratricopeptide (TPR) repeat protein
MSGGRAAIRGYLVQTLVALLEALDSDRDWLSVTLEPDHLSEKIDILWQYTGKIKAVQVKSSVNPFTDAAVKKWARDLETSRGADEYLLILVGTPSKPAVAKARCLGKVAVPAPKTLDLTAFRQQAAHLLDRFMAAEALPTGGADYREMLADALVGKLVTLATKAQPFSRAELVALLKTWITETPKDVPLFPIFDCPPRNPWFTGRDNEIADLRQLLCQTGKAAIGQAITGLGGIGKTQTAIEYAHRHNDRYDAVFWINAATDLDLMTGYRRVAKLLRLPHDADDSASVLAAVKRWLENVDRHCWLLVFDNADEPPLLQPYLPGGASQGHILVTSRVRLDVVGIRSALSMQKLPVEASTQFLLDRADRAPGEATERQAAKTLAAELDGLPLALEQAAAYVAAMHVSYEQYLETYQRHKLGLLERHGPETGAYPATVAKTWLINFEQVEAASKAAADLLRLSAMLAPDEIPLELLTEGVKQLSEPLCAAIDPSDPLTVNEVLEPLARFSLIAIDPEAQTYSVHRLVQDVVKDGMGDGSRRAWAECAVRAMDAAFPYIEFGNWSICDRLIPQAMNASTMIREFTVRSEEAGRLLNQAAFYLTSRGQFAVAEPLCRQSLEIRREVFGEYHPSVATCLNNLAALCRWTGRFQDAVAFYRESLAVYSHLSQVPYDDFAATINNLAMVYQLMGRYDDAEPLFDQAKDRCRRVFGEESPSFASIISNLAMLYEVTGRYDEARLLLQRALEIRRRVLGTHHPEYALSLNNLAMLLTSTGHYQEAEPLVLEALELCRNVIGKEHPQSAASLNNLAELYRLTGRYDEAEPLHREALEVRRRVLGEGHPEFADSLNNLAELYCATDRYVEAEPLYQQALDVYRCVLGQHHPRLALVLNNLASLYVETQRHAEAEPLYRQALEIYRQVQGEQHPDFGRSLNNLGFLCYSAGRDTEAEPLCRQALEILLNVLGAQHPLTKTAQANCDALRLRLEAGHGGD